MGIHEGVFKKNDGRLLKSKMKHHNDQLELQVTAQCPMLKGEGESNLIFHADAALEAGMSVWRLNNTIGRLNSCSSLRYVAVKTELSNKQNLRA